jgi:hypothetical protein
MSGEAGDGESTIVGGTYLARSWREREKEFVRPRPRFRANTQRRTYRTEERRKNFPAFNLSL